jgi:hypothetical protein
LAFRPPRRRRRKRARARLKKNTIPFFFAILFSFVRALVRAGVNEVTRLTECAHAERSTLALEREWKSCERAAKQLFHSQ